MNQSNSPLDSRFAAEQAEAGLLKQLCGLWMYLIRQRSVQIVALLVLMILSAVMEMATLAAVVPLIGSLVDSQSDSSNLIAGSEYLPAFIINADDPHAWVLGGAVIIVCAAAIVRILVLRQSASFSADVGVELQVSYFRYLLNRDYETAINESSSHSISLVSNKIQIVITTYILGMLQALAAAVSALGVIVILLWLSTPVVLLALGVLVASYLLIAWRTRTKLKQYGRDLQVYIPRKVQIVQEGLGGFRDVAMGGTQEVYTRKLHYVAAKAENAAARLVFYNGFPKPLIEAVGISTVAGIAWLTHKGLFAGDNLMPTLGVFAVGMIRLLPFVQQLFAQWARLFNGQTILAELMKVLVYFDQLRPEAHQRPEASRDMLPFAHQLELSDVSFAYSGIDKPALAHINLTINKGDYIGVVGPTGSGKSTLVDIIMGLLLPTSGCVQLDGVLLDHSNRAHWRHQIAHVPQKIFLSSGSIESNIAFAAPEGSIDQERVALCARLACLEEFIESLPDRFDTLVGEDGVRLSGGQRQRIGIARALYTDSTILVFDEATNALDEVTERQIVDGLLRENQHYTIIVITHNLASVKHCHRVLMVDEGRVRWRD